MLTLPELIAVATPIEGGFQTEIPANWLQGRTAYGGLSTALALHAAQQSDVDLPHLRSAQISFVGPLAGNVRVVATRLRRGRNAAFIQVDVLSDAGLGLRAVFVFVSPRPSSIAFDERIVAAHAAPPSSAKLYSGPEGFFTHNFEFMEVEPKPSGASWLRWARLRDRQGLDPVVELMTMADALPPAALRLLGDFAPLSSLSWIVNLLEPLPTTREGWWLLSAESDYAQMGTSSQRMRMWNADGALVAEGMQSVVIFA